MVGGVVYDIKFSLAILNGIFWYEVKYKEDKSFFIFSVIGIQPSSPTFVGCPFLKIVIGSPLLPAVDQLLEIVLLDLAVLPKRKLCPHLPSYIVSPANDKIE